MILVSHHQDGPTEVKFQQHFQDFAPEKCLAAARWALDHAQPVTQGVNKRIVLRGIQVLPDIGN